MNKDEILDELSVLQERFANGMGWRDGEYEEALDEAIELIDEMPDIVRCKDCHFYDRNNNGGLKKHGFCEIYKGFKTDDGFCDLGERGEME